MHSMALDWSRPGTRLDASGRSNADRITRLLAGHFFLFALAIAAGLLEHAVQPHRELLLYPACLGLTLSVVWILWSWAALRGTLFDPYAIFMIAASLFNGGQAFLELFHLNSGGMLRGRVSPEQLLPAIYLVTLSLLAIHGGALFAALKKLEPRPANTNDEHLARATRGVGWLLIGLAAVPAIIFLRTSLSIVLEDGYMGLYRREGSTSVIWAFTGFLVPGVVFLLAGARNSRAIRGLCFAIASGYAAVNLFMGARAAAVMTGVAVIWVFDRLSRRIPRILIVALSIAALVAFSWIRETRGLGGASRLSLDQQLETISNLQDPLASSIAEMGYSLVTVTHTVALVPSIRDFDHGLSYLYAGSAIIPNLGWEIHPGKSHGLLGDWLAQTVDPVMAASGGGWGFSFIAEAYLNFGWAGGLAWLGFIGFLITRLFLRADLGDPASVAFVGAFLSSFLVFVRGESATVVRGLVWYSVIPYLMVAALSVRSRRNRRI
jgi:oligosaccharide repeat unit polymerase